MSKRRTRGMPARNKLTSKAASVAEDHTGPKRSENAFGGIGSSSTFPVVGVGASAGGLAAVTELLKRLPHGTGAAIVIIQHLDPKHGSLTTDILSRVSPMPVDEVKDGMKIQPNHVYVIPPNSNMRLLHGVLRLSPRTETRGQHLPIDLFFKSLADDRKDKAIGVVLSGIASDGTMGIQAIKAGGGFTFAQDPTSAQYDGMPRSAIQSGAVDTVETPEGIAREIAKVSGLYSARRRSSRRAVGPALSPRGPDGNLRKIFASIRNATGVDFTHYKHSTIQRRIARRLFLLKIDDLQTYAAHLGTHPEEVHALFADVLIHVTGFFRDPEAYEALKSRILPKYMEKWDPAVPFRIWVPGCSSGEEAYSIAIVFFEFLNDARVRPQLQIFASDISEPSLQKARSGIYSESITKDVSKARLNRFFEKKEGGRYRIAKWIRDTCLFSRHDITADPPFAKVDLISCRNVLIYFTSELQKRVVPILHYALNPGGILWLGHSETIAGFGALFAIEDRANRFYSKKAIATPLKLQFPVGPHLPELLSRTPPNSAAMPQDVQAQADRVAVQQYAPPGVVVNDAAEILQVRGRPAPYVELAPGQASLNLFKLAHPAVLSALRYLIRSARKDNAATRRDGLSLKKNGQQHNLAVRVVPFRPHSESKERYFSIFFEEEAPSTGEPALPPKGGRGTPLKRGRRQRQIEQQRLVEDARTYQQELIEEYETTQEELISSNEELQSTNEELQSTNEELETAKEELQSANEEMTTINDELQTRNSEMTQVSNDLTNLLASVDIPIVMVGADARIRRFTPKAGQILNLIPTDVGRPIGDIKPNIQAPDLDHVVADVMASLSVKELEAQDEPGNWYRLQVRPYRTAKNEIDGAVVALTDITALKRAAEVLTTAHDDARRIIETMPTPILVIASDRRVQAANDSFYNLFKVEPSETEGMFLSELCDGRWNIPSLLAALETLVSEGRPFRDFELEQDFPRIGHKYLVLHATRTFLTGPGANAAMLAIEDLTARKETADRLQHAEELEHRALLARETSGRLAAEQASRIKDDFLATLSHELRTPLTTILTWAQMLRRGKIEPQTMPQAFGAIEKSARDQAELIDDLLDVSRIQAGKLLLDLRDIEPTDCINAAVESVRTAAETKSITVRSELDPSGCWVRADSGRLQQVLQNLLANAVKFTPPGGNVTVRSRRTNDQKGLEIQVEDTGKGIKPQFLPLLFTRFMQEDSTTKRGFGGLGLGLSIVRNLVEMHGGAVTASSPGEGQGSVFTVTLPCVEGPPARENAERVPASRQETAERTEPADLNGLRVLVIDDLEDARQAFSVLLQSAGAHVEAAATSASGLAVLARFKPHVVLCDIAMPGEDGFGFIRKVRAMTPSQGGKTPCVALTAFAGVENAQKSLGAGFDAHLPKPVDAVDLSHLIAKLAERVKEQS